MHCVTTVRYFFLIKGKPRCYLTPSLGLRQGDPLLPYLFLLGAEGFSALLSSCLQTGSLPGISVCSQAPAVNHLFFADDSILYAEASLDACNVIHEVIDIYSRTSDQVVNMNKSSIVFSKNVGTNVQELVSSVL